MAETTEVHRLDYGKPPPGYTICGDADEPQVRAGIALSSRDSGWVWLPGSGKRVIGVRSWEEALAATWAHHKASNDPPGLVILRIAGGAAAWLLVELCTDGYHDGYKTATAARAAAWAWYDCRLGLAEKWQRIYDTDGDARQLAVVRYRGADDEMAFDNWWPRCLTWPDEQVAKVERWLADSTAEMPEVLCAAPAPNHGLLDALATTAGQAIGEGYEIDFGGACPVQGTGLVDGHEAYYRARGDGWSLEIYAFGVSADDLKAKPIFHHRDADLGASWMPADKSRAHIETAVALFREQNATEVLRG